jgi:hypothetical protein
MRGVVDFAKYVVARVYPVLVWGALMGFAAHAALKTQFMHNTPETEQLSVLEKAPVGVPAQAAPELSSPQLSSMVGDTQDRTPLL